MAETTTNALSLPALFLEAVEKSPNRVALRHKEYGIWRDITWTEYRDHVEWVALALREMGLKPGDHVGIIGDNSPEWVMIDLGVQSAGGISVGIYATNAWEQCQYIVNHAACTFFFVENEEQLDKWLRFRDDAPSLQRVIFWDDEGLRDFNDPMVHRFDALIERGKELSKKQAGDFEKMVAAVKPEDISMLIYTSGTTGPPKGAMLSHRNVVWASDRVTLINPELRLTQKDEVMSFLPLCHIFERLFSVLTHFSAGYVVSFVESPDTVAQNQTEIAPTMGYGVPRLWEKYYASIQIKMSDATWFKRLIYGTALKLGMKHAEIDMTGQTPPLHLRLGAWLAHVAVFRKLKKHLGFDRMRLAISSAAPISPDILKFFRAIGLNMVEGYGQTESAGILTGADNRFVKLGTVGRAAPGMEIRIADDGEILARSEGVFKGYYKDPERTRGAIDEEGWLHTGDIGEIDEDGFVRIVDRKKDLIITAGGKNIAPQYIENKLKFSPYVTDAIVIGDRRKFLTALIVLDEDIVAKYALDNRIPYSTYTELTENQAILDLIQKEVNGVNKTLARVENVRKFRILPKRLYQEDGEVTPTMKVKRSFINEAYGDLIESMYA